MRMPLTSDAALLALLCLFIGKCLETTIGVLPADRLHERVHVACGLGAEVHVIGMLASGALRPRKRRDRELIEAREIILLGPEADAAIRQEGLVPNGEQRGIVERDFELIAIGDELERLPMIEDHVGVRAATPLHFAALHAENIHPPFERIGAEDVVVACVLKTENEA